jgi:hypothetical protein
LTSLYAMLRLSLRVRPSSFCRVRYLDCHPPSAVLGYDVHLVAGRERQLIGHRRRVGVTSLHRVQDLLRRRARDTLTQRGAGRHNRQRAVSSRPHSAATVAGAKVSCQTALQTRQQLSLEEVQSRRNKSIPRGTRGRQLLQWTWRLPLCSSSIGSPRPSLGLEVSLAPAVSDSVDSPCRHERRNRVRCDNRGPA